MARRRAPFAIALGVAVTLAATGCGGHAATRAEVLARGNAICSTTTRAIDAVAAPSMSSGPPLARYLERVTPLISRQAAALSALPRPTADRAELDRLLTAERALAADDRALAAAARTGSERGTATALERLQRNDAPRLARRYGLGQCTGAVATVR